MAARSGAGGASFLERAAFLLQAQAVPAPWVTLAVAERATAADDVPTAFPALQALASGYEAAEMAAALGGEAASVREWAARRLLALATERILPPVLLEIAKLVPLASAAAPSEASPRQRALGVLLQRPVLLVAGGMGVGAPSAGVPAWHCGLVAGTVTLQGVLEAARDAWAAIATPRQHEAGTLPVLHDLLGGRYAGVVLAAGGPADAATQWRAEDAAAAKALATALSVGSTGALRPTSAGGSPVVLSPGAHAAVRAWLTQCC